MCHCSFGIFKHKRYHWFIHIFNSRQEMCWEWREDGHNLLVSSMISKKWVSRMQKIPTLSDNNNLVMADRFAKVCPLYNSTNQQCLLIYKPIKHISDGKSMVLYFGRHGAKQYIHGKAIKFGYKLWVMATPLGHCI